MAHVHLGPFLWQNGGELVDREGTKSTFNEPAGVAAAQFWVDLVHKHQVTSLPPLAPSPEETTG